MAKKFRYFVWIDGFSNDADRHFGTIDGAAKPNGSFRGTRDQFLWWLIHYIRQGSANKFS
jgi:hypothetical protein